MAPIDFDRRDGVEVRQEERADQPQAAIGEVTEASRQRVLDAVPDGDLQVLVRAFQDIGRHTMAELAGREDRRRGTERVAVDDHRPAGPPLLQKLDRRAHVAPRTIAGVVELAGRVTMGSMR